MKEYVALGTRGAKRDASRQIYPSPYIKALELGKISQLYTYRLWDLEKFREEPGGKTLKT